MAPGADGVFSVLRQEHPRREYILREGEGEDDMEGETEGAASQGVAFDIVKFNDWSRKR